MQVVEEDCGGCDKDNETLEELASYVDQVVKDGKKSPYLCKDCFDYFSQEFGKENTLRCLRVPTPSMNLPT